MVPAPPFSWWVFLGVLAVFVVSSAMFWAHVVRWTENRLWVALRDWAGQHRFKLRKGARVAIPDVLATLTAPAPTALVGLVRRGVTIVQVDTPAHQGQPGRRWNVLVREIDGYWPATALRPSTHERSLADLVNLASFPALLSSERYTVHGADSRAARAVTRSMLVALLPQDLGMVLYGRTLLVDFSTRPFDGIELSRVVALADQLAGHLPAIG